jgi:hypothetical protein
MQLSQKKLGRVIWRVDREENGSDHNAVLYELAVEESVKTKKLRYWKKLDEKLFKENLEKIDFINPERITKKKIDKMVDKLYKVLNGALDTACPKVKFKEGARGNEWFTKELGKLKREVRSR